jgi:hypothetical protein
MSIDAVLAGIQAQAAARAMRITDHAREAMEDEAITLAEIRGYCRWADHRELPGPPARLLLLALWAAQGRPLHIVCTTALPLLVIITVYEPTLPKWLNPIERRRI